MRLPGVEITRGEILGVGGSQGWGAQEWGPCSWDSSGVGVLRGGVIVITTDSICFVISYEKHTESWTQLSIVGSVQFSMEGCASALNKLTFPLTS